MNKSQFSVLSEREEEVLLLSTKGLTDKEIARKLGLSIATVNTYWVRIRTKLGGANRAELVAAAMQQNAQMTLTARELENQQLISEIVRRSEAERQLVAEQARLQAIIDGSPVIIFIKDVQGRYTLINTEFENLLCKTRKEILGKRDYDLFDRDTADLFRAGDRQVLESGETVETEDSIPGPDHPRYFLTVKFALTDADGVRNSVCGFAREITSRKETEEVVQQREQRFRALIENSNEIVTLLSETGHITYSSPAMKRFMGFDPAKMESENAFKFIVRADLAAARKDFDYLLAKPGNSVDSEYRVLHADGWYRYMEGHGKNMLEDPSVQAIVLNFRDVTQRKMSELRMAAQYGVASVLSSAHDILEAAPESMRTLCETLGADYGAVWLTDDAEKLRYIGGWNRDLPKLQPFVRESKTSVYKKGEAFPGMVWEKGRPVWRNDLGELQRMEAAEQAGFHIAVGFPILAGREILGVVELFAKHVAPEDQEFIRGLTVIGHQIGQFIRRKEAEAQETTLAAELKSSNESLERRARTRTIELEEANLRLMDEISERKRAEDDLLNEHRFIQSVIESSVDGILAFDRQCCYTIWNKSMERISGLSKEQVLGAYAFDLFPFLTEIGEDAYFHRALRGEMAVSHHRPYAVAGTGKSGFFDAHYTPLRNEKGEIIGGLAFIRETTDVHAHKGAELC